MSHQHKQLAAGRWFKFPFFDQMAHIGSEIERTIAWKEKGKEYSAKAFERALELLDLTIADSRNKLRLRELARLREILVDYFCYDNQYRSSDQLWHKYFYAFNYAARLKY